MKNELTTTEGKRPIIMKNGITLWVSEESATKLEQHIVTQKGHGFIRLQECNTTINTAEVQGIYTIREYESLRRIKNGEWQCQFQTWHDKKDHCQCQRDRVREAREKIEEAARNQPMTPEEREQAHKTRRRITEHMILSGILPHKGREVRRSTIIDFEQEGKTIQTDLSSLIIEEDL